MNADHVDDLIRERENAIRSVAPQSWGRLRNVVRCALALALSAVMGAVLVCLIGGCNANNNHPIHPGDNENGWDWRFIGAPMADSTVHEMSVDPDDENLWYVGGQHGLYITRDGGLTWERPLAYGIHRIEVDARSPATVYVLARSMYKSDDHGRTWSIVSSYPESFVWTIHVSKRTQRVLASYSTKMYASDDRGASWTLTSFGAGQPPGLIAWDIEESVTDGTLYVGTEIGDHPQPYKPPFFRSTDGGLSWEDIAPSLPWSFVHWHIIRLQTHPSNSTVYALSEAAGLYRSDDAGDHWAYLNNDFGLELLLDERDPKRLYGGAHTFGGRSGGAFLSTDGGRRFSTIGLKGLIVGSLCLNGQSTRLFATCFGSGIYVAQVEGRGVAGRN